MQLGIQLPDNHETTIMELGPGDIAFIPQAWAHYIQNVGTDELTIALTFGSSDPDDVGLSTMFGAFPTSTFERTLGVGRRALAKAFKPRKTRFIVR
jgi:oxalate decarboxylase/phosphoglucose isomerase-like protein (cupin superfamily)